MKVVISPDSFKGSLSARHLCSVIKKGVYHVFPEANVMEVPLADGGEGTMENMVYATKGQIYETDVSGPLGQKIRASYGVLGDNRTAVIEVAQASGLTLIPDDQKNPLIASSYGTGELIRQALDAGYRRFIIGLGGSATNDGGAGMLKALGMRFYDKMGKPLPEGGGHLSELAYIDDSQFNSCLKEADFLIASDVTNPLCGSNGASVVFGPQKGATAEMVQQLDQSLTHYADIVEKMIGMRIRHLPGTGAAGGIGAAFLGFFNATLNPGISLVMETIRFEELIKDADLVITGEGKLDSQTLHGKVIAGVSQVTSKYNIPVVALCGQKNISESQIKKLGITAGFSIVPGPVTLEEAMANTPSWIMDQVVQILKVIRVFKG
jgi:glycerate kinase